MLYDLNQNALVMSQDLGTKVNQRVWDTCWIDCWFHWAYMPNYLGLSKCPIFFFKGSWLIQGHRLKSEGYIIHMQVRLVDVKALAIDPYIQHLPLGSCYI